MLTTLSVLFLALAGQATVSSACFAGPASVKRIANPAVKNDSREAYTVGSVKAHFDNHAEEYLSNTDTTFSCVDARGDQEVSRTLSTPGGDLAELQVAIAAYHKLKGTRPTLASVKGIFSLFMSKVASPARPFYFHTDDTKILKAFSYVDEKNGKLPQPTVFPITEPKNDKVADAWYDALTKTEAQGCGHVRLMLEDPALFGLGAKLGGNFIPKTLIETFFKYWWPTPEGSTQRSKVQFVVKQGPLQGHAVTVVNNTGPACLGKSPTVQPSFGGSTMFVAHLQAASDMRSKVLAPIIRTYDPSVDEAALVDAMNDLFNIQLTAVLGNLPPANEVPIFALDVATYSKRKPLLRN